MSRPGRLLAWGSLAALLVLSGCTSATTGSAVAGRSSASGGSAAPSTPPPAARPARVRLHGQVAFASDRDGNDEVYLMDADGSQLTRLTHAPSGEQEPAFTPCSRACP